MIVVTSLIFFSFILDSKEVSNNESGENKWYITNLSKENEEAVQRKNFVSYYHQNIKLIAQSGVITSMRTRASSEKYVYHININVVDEESNYSVKINSDKKEIIMILNVKNNKELSQDAVHKLFLANNLTLLDIGNLIEQKKEDQKNLELLLQEYMKELTLIVSQESA